MSEPEDGASGPLPPSRLAGLYVGTGAGSLAVLLVRFVVLDIAPGPVGIVLLVTALLLTILGVRGIRREQARS